VVPTFYKEGLYFYNPIGGDMYEIDVKVQKLVVEKAEAASRDLQDVHSDVVVNFRINGEKCHELLINVGPDYKSRIMIPGVHEELKAATAHFPVEKIIQERSRLKDEIIKGLRARFAPYQIDVVDIALVNFGFSKDFVKAVESKQIEEQRIQQKEYERQQAIKIAEAAVARARGEAESNRLVRESLTKDLIQFEALKKWDGKLPLVTSGGIPLINVDSLVGKGGKE